MFAFQCQIHVPTDDIPPPAPTLQRDHHMKEIF